MNVGVRTVRLPKISALHDEIGLATDCHGRLIDTAELIAN
jgi:hypothetical protein